MTFLDELAARRRFGMRPGLETITALASALGDPQRRFPAIHVAGTDGKGAVCAMLDGCLRHLRSGRYTSPHLVRINERFFLDGRPVDDETLERLGAVVADCIQRDSALSDVTFFEALTAVAFLLYAESKVDVAVLECGLGGRLDATNVCASVLSVITRIGLDHCDWLGDTVEKIAAEKAGIIRLGVPVVLGENVESVRAVVENRAKELGAPFFYAPDLASVDEIPPDFPLLGNFNRENAVTAIAALKVYAGEKRPRLDGLSRVVWPGRFQRVGNFIVDGAHNPPAARALVASLDSPCQLIAGFCGDKDASAVLRILAPSVRRAFAVRTNNPRSLAADETARLMRDAGLAAEPCMSLGEALAKASEEGTESGLPTLVCGSLFLAGEALVALDAYPWPARFDPNERLKI